MNNEFMLKKGIVKSEEQLKEVNRKIYNLGKENGLPIVATGDVHFLDPKDAKFREILMKGQGFSDAEDQPPLYLKTTNEMLKEFEYLGEDAFKEVVIYNPQKIAEEVEVIKPIPDETRSEEHTSELQSRQYLVCRLLLEKKKQHK